jgi:hypothetical protein
MPVILDCPNCPRKLRVPDELLGTRVQCPSCGTAFQAPAGPPPLPDQPPPIPGSPTEASAGPPPAPEPPVKLALEEERTTREPRAAVPIGKTPGEAPRRPESRDEDDEDYEDDRPWEHRRAVRRDCEPHRGGVVLALGIVSIVLAGLPIVGIALGIAAWVMGQRDLRKIRARTMDPEGSGTTQAGWICGIIGTIMSSLATLACVAYIALIAVFVGVASQNIKAAKPPTKTIPAPQQPPQDKFFQK